MTRSFLYTLDAPPQPGPSTHYPSNLIPQPNSMPSPHPQVKRCDSMDSTLATTETKSRTMRIPAAVQTDPIREATIPSSSATLESSAMSKRSGRSLSGGRLSRISKVDAFTQTFDEPIPLSTLLDTSAPTTSIPERNQSPAKETLPSDAPKAEIPTLSMASSAASSASPSHQRSLSPMEIDSNPTSPDYSPEQFCVDLTNDEEDVEELVLPKATLPTKIDTSKLSSIVTMVNKLASSGELRKTTLSCALFDMLITTRRQTVNGELYIKH